MGSITSRWPVGRGYNRMLINLLARQRIARALKSSPDLFLQGIKARLGGGDGFTVTRLTPSGCKTPAANH